MAMKNISGGNGLSNGDAGDNMDDDESIDGFDENQNDGDYDPLTDLYGDGDDDSGFDIGDDLDDESNNDDDDDDDDAGGKGRRTPNGAPPADPNEALIKEMNGILDQMMLGADEIPEDFDPGNPKMFREVVAKAQRQAVATAMQLMTKPIQLAMKQTQEQMIAEMGKMMRRGQTTNKLESAFEELKPLIGGNKKVMAFARDNFIRSYKATKDLTKATKATREILKQLGFQGGGNRRNSNNPFEGGSEVKSGAAVLDSFLPVPPRQRRS